MPNAPPHGIQSACLSPLSNSLGLINLGTPKENPAGGGIAPYTETLTSELTKQRQLTHARRKLTQNEKFRMELCDLLVEAVSSVLAARQNKELGEVYDDTKHIPTRVMEQLLRPRSRVKPKRRTTETELEFDAVVPDELKSKTERSWDNLHDYSLALIDWVETTRSRALIPLKIHLLDYLDIAEEASGEVIDIPSLLANIPQTACFAKTTLARHRALTKLGELDRRLSVIEERFDRLERIKQRKSQVCAMEFSPRNFRAEEVSTMLDTFRQTYSDQSTQCERLKSRISSLPPSTAPATSNSSSTSSVVSLTFNTSDLDRLCDNTCKKISDVLHDILNETKDACSRELKNTQTEIADKLEVILGPVMRAWQSIPEKAANRKRNIDGTGVEATL